MNISFKPLTEMKDMKIASQLIKEIWGEDNGISPYLLMAHSHVGGFVIGAYEKEQIIGVSYGNPGVMEDGEPFFYSHLLVVLPEYRGRNVGENLKRIQAEMVIQNGYNQIKWTFDPLESRNAYFNIHKLGATSDVYHPNFYGETTDPLNAGIPTDRLIIEWNIAEKNKTNSSLELERYTRVMKVDLQDNHLPFCKGWIKTTDHHICIAVPTEVQEIKKESMEYSLDWRMRTREAFLHYFTNDYYIVDFHFNRVRNVQYYVLHKR